MQPRLVGWAGEVAYRYSGQTLEPRPFTDTVRALTERVKDVSGARFNHVLLNRYRDGRDSMGMHADDEPELGPDPVVATLSLGAPRRRLLVPRRPRDGERRSLELPPGSLLAHARRLPAPLPSRHPPRARRDRGAREPDLPAGRTGRRGASVFGLFLGEETLCRARPNGCA